MSEVLTLGGMFLIGSWCGIGLMCLFVIIPREENKPLRPDAPGPVRINLQKEEN